MRKLLAWLRGSQPADPAEQRPLGPRREFIYLDEVSVYSLIASRLGSIPEQLTKSAAASFEDELSSSVGVAAGLKSEVGARSSATTTTATQVVRKSLVQGAFKELAEAEAENLALAAPGTEESPPVISTAAALVPLANADGASWVADPECLKRGQLLELEVELDADPAFAFNTAVSSMVEIMDENPELFGAELEGIAAGEMMVRVLDRLLAGLVPLRCRVLDYRSVIVGKQELLVHRRVLEALDLSGDPATSDVHLVGVAEKDLFWRDLRRVLFSHSRVTVMCRLGHDGLQRSWSPVKLADVFKQVVPQIGDQLDIASAQMMAGFRSGAAASLAPSDNDTRMRRGMRLYAASYAAHCGGPALDLEFLGDLLEPEPEIDYEETEARRQAVESLTERLRELFQQAADPRLEARLRGEAMGAVGFGVADRDDPANDDGGPVGVEEGRFLDAEIVAIYW